MVPVKTNSNWLPSIFNDFFEKRRRGLWASQASSGETAGRAGESLRRPRRSPSLRF